MEEFNKLLWDAIEDKGTASGRARARASFLNFRRLAGLGAVDSRRKAGVLQWLVRAAAAFALPLACLCAFLLFQGQESPSWNEVSTGMGQTTQVVLADKTRVTLNGGSTIVYPSSFSKRIRQVYFCGEGYFEVQADAKHPFDLLVNDAHLHVTGTKFNLKSYAEDKAISISLDEGRVAFESNENCPQKVSCEMVPGDLLTFDKETGVLTKNYSESNSGMWRKGEYYFKNETLRNIARDIERIFGVRVIVEREELLDTHYHMALVNGETVDDLVRILSLDRSLSVTRVGNTIVIK